MSVAVVRSVVVSVWFALVLVACGDDGDPDETQLGAPTDVAATAGIRAATVTWTAPSQTRGALTGYVVTVHPGGATVSVPASVTTADVPDLLNATSYTFTVTASDGEGSGPDSAASAAITTPDVPGAPTGVTAVAANASAMVSWTAPASDGGRALTGYTITVSPGGATSTAGASASTAVVSGLANGTAYTFTVTAQNGVGSSAASAASASVTPIVLPAAPTSIVATAGNASATVTWVAPVANGSVITGYTVTSTPGGFTASVGASALTVPVNGLTNGVTYTFTVRATSAAGAGAESVASNAVTPITVPTAPSITMATSGNGQVTVTWTAPSNTGGSPITGYVVTSTPGSFTASTNGTTTTVAVTGLANGTPYTFTVYAQNAAGNGPASAMSSSVTPATVPGAPTAVAATPGNAQAQVTWTAPASNGGSAITAYTVTSNPGNFTATVAGTASTATVTGLANGTPYTFTVVATNSAGNSAASQASSAVTPFTVAGAPAITMVMAGNTQVTVTWTAPASNGGSAITGYVVTSTPGSFTASTNGTTTSVAVTGLSNGTSYTFTVLAKNAAGDGPASAASSSVTPAAVPGAPTAVSATPGNAQATVSWAAPASNGGSAITGYTVTSNPGNLTATVSGSASQAIVTGLTNGTPYTFTVVATNVMGNSAASSASSSVTPITVPGAPSITTVTAGNTQVTVTWTAPASTGGTAITGYVVTSTPGSFTASTNGSTTTVAVTGLTNGVAYQFSVVAQNAAGTGPASALSSAVTPAQPPGAPSNIVATAGNQQVSLTWTAAPSNGATITGYLITSSTGNFSKTVATTSATVVGPVNGTTYTFDVVATSSAGNGAVGTSNSVVPSWVPDPPLSVRATRGNTQATVYWSAPSFNQGSSVLSYTVTSNPGNFTATVSAPTTQAVVTGLTNGTDYKFSVTAANAIGSSASSAETPPVRPGTQPLGKPAAPAQPGAVAGNGNAKIFWTAPGMDGGATITSYVVTSSGGGTVTVTAPLTWATFPSLSNGTAYTFTVAAVNSQGTGTASTASSAVTPLVTAGVCASAANTTPTASVWRTGCAVLARDTSACNASRTSQGLSGFWLDLSCRITLTKTTVSSQPVVQIHPADGWPDYLSPYFTSTDNCHEYYAMPSATPSSIVLENFTMTVPYTPNTTSATTMGHLATGVAVNGVLLFGNYAALGDDIYNESLTFDRCGGHVNSTGYHYHTEPWAISQDDSNLVGVMKDGYPIYGRRDVGGAYPVLDAQGGHTGTTSHSPVALTYHYHLNFQTSTGTETAGFVDWFVNGGDFHGTPGTCSGC